MASDRTCTVYIPGRRSPGSCAVICPEDVWSKGIATSLSVTQDPPRTLGAGSWAAVPEAARFAPLTRMNEPGRMPVVPSEPFTIPEDPAVICGAAEPCGASGITLNPESVRIYTVPFECTAIIRGGTLVRVVPKTVTGGFSASAPTTETDPLRRSANSS